jgi:hypothetical protein
VLLRDRLRVTAVLIVALAGVGSLSASARGATSTSQWLTLAQAKRAIHRGHVDLVYCANWGGSENSPYCLVKSTPVALSILSATVRSYGASRLFSGERRWQTFLVDVTCGSDLRSGRQFHSVFVWDFQLENNVGEAANSDNPGMTGVARPGCLPSSPQPPLAQPTPSPRPRTLAPPSPAQTTKYTKLALTRRLGSAFTDRTSSLVFRTCTVGKHAVVQDLTGGGVVTAQPVAKTKRCTVAWTTAKYKFSGSVTIWFAWVGAKVNWFYAYALIRVDKTCLAQGSSEKPCSTKLVVT